MINSGFVILDGETVKASAVSPVTHRFLGMWRPPVNPHANPTTDIMCACGEILRYRGQENDHYRKGCFDSPQYVSLKAP